MIEHRRSYAKTVVLAAIGGTGCLLVGLLLLCAAVMELPGMQAVLVLPFPIRVIAGIMFLGLTLFGYSVTAGGVLALRFDAKGRAAF